MYRLKNHKMSLKAVLLLVCCFVAVNSFSVSRSDERKSRSDGSSLIRYEVRPGGRSDYSSNEQSQFGQGYPGNREGSTEGQSGSGYPNRVQYGGRSGGQKVGLRYTSSSSSSSSEENSSESHEIRKVEKQYHDTHGYNSGNSRYEPDRSRHYKVMNFEATDLRNAIDKDM